MPVVPGTPGAVEAWEDAEAFTKEHGFPVIIKAAFGGGGRGMRVVREQSEMQTAFERATSEAKSAFGDGTVFIERAYSDLFSALEAASRLEADFVVLFLSLRQVSSTSPSTSRSRSSETTRATSSTSLSETARSSDDTRRLSRSLPLLTFRARPSPVSSGTPRPSAGRSATLTLERSSSSSTRWADTTSSRSTLESKSSTRSLVRSSTAFRLQDNY